MNRSAQGSNPAPTMTKTLARLAKATALGEGS
jgi:hypothetical protein